MFIAYLPEPMSTSRAYILLPKNTPPRTRVVQMSHSMYLQALQMRKITHLRRPQGRVELMNIVTSQEIHSLPPLLRADFFCGHPQSTLHLIRLRGALYEYLCLFERCFWRFAFPKSQTREHLPSLLLEIFCGHSWCRNY